MKTFSIILILFSSILLEGCYYDNEEELYGLCNVTDTTTISFSEDIQPILQNNCSVSGCHVSSNPGRAGKFLFDSYDKVQSYKGKIDTQVVINRTMPQGSTLDECKIKKIDRWIKLGAPNN